MRVPSPTSRSGKRVYLSLWDLTWAVGSPLLALYLRDPEIFSRTDLSAIGYYWALAAGFAVLAFFAFKIHDNMTPYFSVHEAIDIVETVLFVELLTFVSLFSINHFDGIPRSIPLTHGVLLAAALFAARIFIRIVRGDDEAQPTFAYSGERIILIGANPVAGLFIRLLGACAPQRQHVIALLDADAAMIGRAIAGVQVVGNPQDLEAHCQRVCDLRRHRQSGRDRWRSRFADPGRIARGRALSAKDSASTFRFCRAFLASPTVIAPTLPSHPNPRRQSLRLRCRRICGSDARSILSDRS